MLEDRSSDGDYHGENFDIVNANVTFKQDGEYLLVYTYGLNKWNDENGSSGSIAPNLKTDGYIFHPASIQFNLNVIGNYPNLREIKRHNNFEYSRDYQSGWYPYAAKTIKFIRVENGKIEILPLEDREVVLDYKTISADYDLATKVLTFKDEGKIQKTFLRLDNKIHFNNCYPLYFNEYKSLTTWCNETYEIKDNNFINTSGGKIDYYDGWFSYNDHLYFNILQVLVIKLES